jgi:hypothetical protein
MSIAWCPQAHWSLHHDPVPQVQTWSYKIWCLFCSAWVLSLAALWKAVTRSQPTGRWKTMESLGGSYQLRHLSISIILTTTLANRPVLANALQKSSQSTKSWEINEVILPHYVLGWFATHWKSNWYILSYILSVSCHFLTKGGIKDQGRPNPCQIGLLNC